MKQLAKCIIIAMIMFTAGCNNKSKTDYNDFTYLEITVEQAHAKIVNGELTVEELIGAFLQRIDAIDRSGPELNSIIAINPDALDIARELDKEIEQGIIRGPLHGIPIVLKDNIDTHDRMPTTAGSMALKESYPLKDSHIAKQLRKAGAVIIGKANLSEWANFRGQLSTSGWSGVGGLTKNPYNLSRNPCGSSAGSGVAVSANLAIIAIGTETNGSIVCPSHANGIVGLKPTVGLVSRSGVIPISYTQDSPGPMARTVGDVAVCLGALVGVDKEDDLTLQSEGNYYTDYTQFLQEDGLAGKRIGLFTAPMGRNFKVDTLMNQTTDFLRSKGAEVIEISQISAPTTGLHSFEVMLYEYKDGLNKYFKSLGPDAPIQNLEELIAFNRSDSTSLKYFNQLYLEMAQDKDDLASEGYQQSLKKLLEESRTNGIDRVMNEHNLDAIMAPTGGPAWKTDLINGDSFQLGSSSPSAHAGYPIITLPMGYVDGLPVGISFFGKAWSEATLLEIAYAYEVATNNRRVPKFLNANRDIY